MVIPSLILNNNYTLSKCNFTAVPLTLVITHVTL
jgi:hypothetical protein